MRFHFYTVQLLKRHQKPSAQDQVLTLSVGTPGIAWSSLNFLGRPPKACMTQAPRPGYSEGFHEWPAAPAAMRTLPHTQPAYILQLQLCLLFSFFKNALPHPLLLHESIYYMIPTWIQGFQSVPTPSDFSLHWILKAHIVCSPLGDIIVFCFGLLT